MATVFICTAVVGTLYGPNSAITKRVGEGVSPLCVRCTPPRKKAPALPILITYKARADGSAVFPGASFDKGVDATVLDASLKKGGFSGSTAPRPSILPPLSTTVPDADHKETLIPSLAADVQENGDTLHVTSLKEALEESLVREQMGLHNGAGLAYACFMDVVIHEAKQPPEPTLRTPRLLLVTGGACHNSAVGYSLVLLNDILRKLS